MVLFAGCGGLLGGDGDGNTSTEQTTVTPGGTSEMETGEVTTSGGSVATGTSVGMANASFTSEDGTTVNTDTFGGSETVSSETGTVTGRTTANGTMRGTTQSSSANTANTLLVVVEPNTAQAENLTMTMLADVPNETAATGIQRVTIKFGGGLNYSGISVSNLPRLGIDRGGNAPATIIDESLILDVGNVKVGENKSEFTIEFSETIEVGPGDEIIAVLPNSVSSGKAGTYAVNVTVNGNSTMTGNYTIS